MHRHSSGALFVFLLLAFSSLAAALAVSLQSFTIATTGASPDIKLFVEKTFYNQNESIELYGVLFNVTASSGVASTFSPLSGQAVSVNVSNATNLIAQYNFTTDNNGTFYSNSSYYPAAPNVYAPNQSGSFSLRAQFNDSGTLYTSTVGITVGNKTIDQLLIQPSRFEYSPGEAMNVTVSALRGSGTQTVKISGVYVNGSLRYANQTVLANFSCTTGSDGTCTISMNAPASSAFESFILEANNYLGYAYFHVTSFSVDAAVLDADGQTPKDVFTQNENAVVRIAVSVNTTQPASGSYTANVTLGYSNGSVLDYLPLLALISNNSYSNQTSFSASGLGEGTYLVNVTVSQSGGTTRTQLAFIQVKSWSLSVSKAASNSGFDYGDITLPNATLRFEALPQNRTSGAVISGLASAFSYSLKNPLGVTVGNGTTVVFNSSCGVSGCYEFSLRAPNAVGTYALSVSVTYNGLTRSQSRSVLVDGLTATASTVDGAGLTKAVFSYTEFLNVNFSARNVTSSVNVSVADVVSVTYSNGSKMNYSQQANVSLMNASDNTLEWGWNTSSGRIVMDVPKIGGLYSIELYVNNQTAKTTTRFFANPYDTCFSAKASAAEGSSDYFWQFKPSDTLYIQMTVIQAENLVGANSSSVTAALSSGSYGRGNACSFDSSRKQAVSNASLSVLQVLNLETGHIEALNTTASSCQSLSTTGHYLCTLKPNATAWENGKHEVNVRIFSQDGSVQDVGTAYFETRVFFVYGYANNWINKPASNITLNLRTYEAGDGWWSSSTGLSGTATLQRVEFRGNIGEWFSTGTPFDYNASGLNASTLSNGQGTLSLDANRTPDGTWPTGMYVARVRVTADDGREDYGDAYFEIRNWDAWAQQVQHTGGSIQYRYSNAPTQNVSLYIRISQAGDYNDAGGASLGGSVTVRIKKLSIYGSNGQEEIASSTYSATPITISTTSPYPGSATYATHILNLSPSSRWATGSYNVLLELNGTSNGTGSAARQQSYGWFTIKAFHATSQPVNLTTGSYAYTTRGKAPVGFNVTSALDEQGSYSVGSSSLINTTIVGLRLNRWSETAGQLELKYPNDLNFSPSTVNGTSTINVSLLSGNWSSGWYWGEMRLRDNQTNEQVAYVYFGVKPFSFSVTQNGSTIGYSQNLTGNLTLTDPQSGGSIATSTSNYTLSSAKEIRWTNSGQQVRNAVIHGNTSWNGSARSFAFGPPADTGQWRPSDYGYMSLQLTVRDESDNSTDTYWLSNNVATFSATASVVGGSTLATTANLTLNLTMRQPDGTGRSWGNLSRVQYYDYSTSAYRDAQFVVGSCNSSTSAVCLVNSTANHSNGTVFTAPVTVTVVPQNGTWPEGYIYLDLQFSDNGRLVRPSTSPYLYARNAVSAYYYSVNASTGSYQYSFGTNSSVGYRIYSVQNINSQAMTTNVTSVEHYAGTEWRENFRTYSNLTTYNLAGITTLTIPTSGATINVSPPSGGWPSGSNYLRVTLVNSTNAAQGGQIKSMYFYVNPS